MIFQYLTENIIGACSGYLYGKKGEKVAIIGRDHTHLVKVVNEKNSIYYVDQSFLSSEFVPIDAVPIILPTKKKRR